MECLGELGYIVHDPVDSINGRRMRIRPQPSNCSGRFHAPSHDAGERDKEQLLPGEASMSIQIALTEVFPHLV